MELGSRFFFEEYLQIIFDCEQKIRERKDWDTFSKDPLCVTWIGLREEVSEMEKERSIFDKEFVTCMDYLWKVLAGFWEKCQIYNPPANHVFAKVGFLNLGLTPQEEQEISDIYRRDYSPWCDGHLAAKNKSLEFLLSEVLFERIWEKRPTSTMTFCLDILEDKLRARGLNFLDFSKG